MIYYWSGASGADRLLDEHAETIQNLLTADYNHRDLEKLRGQFKPIIYSYRITEKARLLFTTHKGSLHVLEYLPNHDYQNSRFLKTGVLKKHIASLGKLTLFVPVEEDEHPVFSVEPLAYSSSTELDYYNHQFIHFSETQEAIVQQRQLPLILNGAAGSGKTYVGLGIIKDWLEARPEDTPSRCLYVTEEQLLVDAMQKNWRYYFAVDMPDAVEFKTYAEVFLGIHPDKTIVTQACFEAWWLDLKTNDTVPLATAEAYYQEFRICSGLSREAYLDLGERQSSIPRGPGRDALHALYVRYLNYLGSEKVDLALSSWRPQDVADDARYDFIMVDESQRFSLLQNVLLAGLVEQYAIMYCMDAHQNLVDQHSSRVLLELQLRGVGGQTCTLDKTYRCKPKVANVLTQVLETNRAILGGKIDKIEASNITTTEDATGGAFHMLSPEDVADASWLLSRAKSTHLAVVTHEAYVDDAQKIFKTALVFTPEGIQGQEFHTVVVYKLLADEGSESILKRASSQLKALASSSSSLHRSKAKLGHADAPWAHRIFTACSRPQDTLVIVDTVNAYWQTLRLEKSETSENTASVDLLPATSKADWENMARIQEQKGQSVIAERIRETLRLETEAKKAEPVVATPTHVAQSKQLFEALPLSTQASPQKSPSKKTAVKKTAAKKTDVKKTPTKKSPQKAIVSPFKPAFNTDLGDTLIRKVKSRTRFKHIKKLIDDSSVNLNQKSPMGFTALMFAIVNRDKEVVSKLISMGDRIDLNVAHREGMTPLMLAANEGCPVVFNALVAEKERINFNSFDGRGFTVLMIVAQHTDLEMLEALLAVGDRVNVGYINRDGFTAVSCAAQAGQVACVRALLNTGRLLNLEHVDEQGCTPLTSAIINNHVDVVRVLLHEAHLRFEPENSHHDYLVLRQVIAKISQQKDMVRFLLSERHVLASLIRRELFHVPSDARSATRSFLDNSSTLVSLVAEQRGLVWEIVQELKEGASDDAKYIQMLRDVLNANTSDKQYYGLHLVLLQPVPEHQMFPASMNVEAQKIRQALEAMCSAAPEQTCDMPKCK